MGLPGMCGFVGEFMVVLATWDYSHVYSILAALTVVVTAAYILWTLQRVFMGTNAVYKDYSDINLREQIGSYLADITSRRFNDRESCASAADFEIAVFNMRMDLFSKLSNLRLH